MDIQYIAALFLALIIGVILGAVIEYCLIYNESEYLRFKYFKDNVSSIHGNYISLSDFSLETDTNRLDAEKWLNKKVKEYGGIRLLQNNGDYHYYFGHAYDRYLEG